MKKKNLWQSVRGQKVHIKRKESFHIPDMIPVALPPRVAGDGLEEHSSYFV